MNEPPNQAGARRIVIYACSGCSDAGEIADRAARALSQQNYGEMSCLAGIGGRVKSLMAKAEQAAHIVAIDGCPLNCARHTLERAGFLNVQHLELHRLGLRKGSCPPTEERIAIAVQAGAKLIQRVEADERDPAR
ncbi:MAG: putative zinc-binding protein [Limisphaerales bacterium]